jgi:hypothetical protein
MYIIWFIFIVYCAVFADGIVQWVDSVPVTVIDHHLVLSINHLVCFIFNVKEIVTTSRRKIIYSAFIKAAEKLKRIISWDYFAIIFFTIAADYVLLQRSQMILVTHYSHYSKILYCKHWWIPSRRQKHQWILTSRWQDLLYFLFIF